MNFEKTLLILTEKNILPERRKIGYSFRKVRTHSKNETVEHFLTKSLISFLISKTKDSFLTEYEYPNSNRVDVLQVKTDKTLVGYQIESNSYPDYDEKYFPNTLISVIELKKLPENVKNSFKILEDYFKKVIL
jgi:hypothetical protein